MAVIGVLKPVPESKWPVRCHDPKRSNVWVNAYFLVQEFQEENGVIRLSVNTTSVASSGRWKDGISWDALQEIKSAVGYPPFALQCEGILFCLVSRFDFQTGDETHATPITARFTG